MRVLPIFTHNQDVTETLIQMFTDSHVAELHFFEDQDRFRDYLIYETPEVYIADFSTESSAHVLDLIDSINEEKWLNCSGMIAIHNTGDEKLFNEIKDINLLAVIKSSELKGRLTPILNIVYANSSLLFQREFQTNFTGEVQGEVILENDLLQGHVYTNLLANFLYNVSSLEAEKRLKLRIGIQELLTNAIEHGNCEITYDMKTKFTEQGLFGQEIINAQLKKRPELTQRKVYISYRVVNNYITITIKDEGSGFDWKKRLESNVEEVNENDLMHGRGIFMANQMSERVAYNEAGNEATLFMKQDKQGKVIPSFFEADSMLRVKKGDTVFRFGEESNYLYYIASGRYEVFGKKGDFITTLEPNDIFLGEMSFLIKNQRTATIQASEVGVLHRISKKNFVSAIQDYPYYAFFLCKVLARRLERMNP